MCELFVDYWQSSVIMDWTTVLFLRPECLVRSYLFGLLQIKEIK